MFISDPLNPQSRVHYDQYVKEYTSSVNMTSGVMVVNLMLFLQVPDISHHYSLISLETHLSTCGVSKVKLKTLEYKSKSILIYMESVQKMVDIE